jgi:hypothetical protein
VEGKVVEGNAVVEAAAAAAAAAKASQTHFFDFWGTNGLQQVKGTKTSTR